MRLERLPVLREDFEGIPLPSDIVKLPYQRQFSVDEYERLKLGHLPQSGADFTYALYEDNHLYIYHGSHKPTCWYDVLLAPTVDGASIVEVWTSSTTNIEWSKSDLAMRLDEIIELNRTTPVTSDLWENIKPMPEGYSEHRINELFSERQFCHLMWGQIPLSMDDKWFTYSEGVTLYYHRSWTGICVYRITFEKEANGYRAVSIRVNDEVRSDVELALRLIRGYAGWLPYRYKIIAE